MKKVFSVKEKVLSAQSLNNLRWSLASNEINYYLAFYKCCSLLWRPISLLPKFTTASACVQQSVTRDCLSCHPFLRSSGKSYFFRSEVDWTLKVSVTRLCDLSPSGWLFSISIRPHCWWSRQLFWRNAQDARKGHSLNGTSIVSNEVEKRIRIG